MNKKYYVAPATESIGLHTESTLLAGSVDGFKNTLTEDEGTEELSRKKGGFGGNLWSDMGDE